MSEIQKMLDTNVVLRLWPETGKKVPGLSRGGTYAAAQRGDIKTVRVGRLKLVPVAWLRKQLELDEPNAA